MTWYAQFEEDLYLAPICKRLGIEQLIVDIGAGDGLFLSNSRYFIEQGWEAILVEPNRDIFPHLLKNSEGFPKVTCLNVAIDEAHGNRRLTNERHFTHGKLTDGDGIPCVCIRFEHLNICKPIGILSIDAEGMDTPILLQALAEQLPQIIIVEANYESERVKQANILEQNYNLINTLSVNTVWLRKDFKL